jgi:hypothetical protein
MKEKRIRLVVAALFVGLMLIAGSHGRPVAAAACGAMDTGCDLRQRIAAAEQYLATRPGTIGFVLRDRATGAKYRNANAGTMIWTASTIKLAMVADLLTREQSGAIRLSTTDRQQMVAMLRSSDNDAAVVAEMQRVDGQQQWGVWGAGPEMAPGNKNGWSQEEGGWVVNSVGFAGPQQRHTLAVMNALGGDGGYDDGVATTTELSRILLAPAH